MKKLIALLLVVLMAVSSVACGSKKEAAETKPEVKTEEKAEVKTEEPKAEEPKAEEKERAIKDTLNIALAYDLSSIDPHIGKEMRACIFSQQIFDTLVEYDVEGGIGSEIRPCLATSWEQIDERSMKFHLREGVKFQDGNTMTAEDVKYSLDRCMQSPQVGYNATWMESVEIVDDYTIIIHTHEPYGPMLAALTITPFSIVSKAACEKDPDNFASNPIGTGRYKLVKYTAGEGAQMTAFDECWRGAPKTKNLNFSIVTEATQRTILLETGEVDIAYEVLPNDVARIEANKDLKVATCDGTKVYMATYNCASNGPVGNKLVRQAIEYAVNKEELVDTVLYGYGTPAYNVVGANNICYQEVPERKQDVEKAKKLLAEAGYPDGGFELNIWLDTSNVWYQYATIMQAQLEEVGIKLNIETMESSTLQKREGSDIENYGLGTRFINSITGDARFTIYNLLYSTSSSNLEHWNNSKADELIEKGRSIADPAGSVEIYKELNEVIADDMPVLPLYYDTILVGMSANVEGFIPRGDGIHVYNGNVVCYAD